MIWRFWEDTDKILSIYDCPGLLSGTVLGDNLSVNLTESKYARVEWERRFLLKTFPEHVNASRVHQITDRYIQGTSLRLRQQTDSGTKSTYKLTQKIPDRSSDGRQGLITTMYLPEPEFHIFSALPSSTLSKTRYSIPPFGIDVFNASLHGLVLAEAEFQSAVESQSLELPAFVVREVSGDSRFTGGRLVRASRQELRSWLEEYGISLEI